MKLLIIFLSFIAAQTSFAAVKKSHLKPAAVIPTALEKAYDLQMELTIDGKHVSSPRVLVKPGETASVTQQSETDNSFIEVVATEGTLQNHSGILMKFVVGTIDKDGKRTIVSHPEILAKENEPATITVGQKNGSPEELSLSVVAERKTF